MHSDDRILDAARDQWISGGDAATTASGISKASGAPVGSLYHRFGSRAVLLAHLWTRTVHRFQQGLLDAAENSAPGMERACAAARWPVEFSLLQHADARLLLLTRRSELLDEHTLPEELRQRLDRINEPVAALVRRLATEIFGRPTPERCELVTVAVIDLPYGVVRRHLGASTLQPSHRTLVSDAAYAILQPASAASGGNATGNTSGGH
ncbi:transcriptional regulator, TetR family [Amycolatopsis marina]|uniref:Transcriptional regulator, TetR family n=2 Tax=Amycolatopsis marina TaxID=490629 RepID=A0A1I1BIC6_9PSEU|nr:transcriptional regulator, TetR family [Amycolatopsis marina]